MKNEWPSCTNAILKPGEIHVWCMSLECDTEALPRHRSLLAEDERVRADKFLFDRHRRRFTVGRSKLRQLLGSYTNEDPAAIVFDYSGLGKPRLEGATAGHGLCFNFSNSEERALLAVTNDVEVGVDVERLRTMDSLEGLAERFFAAPEKRYILAQRGAQQTESFFHCWTRKEAFLKAIGKGLTFPLRDVTIALAPQEPVRILDINDHHESAVDWTLEHLDVEPHYVGAVACRRLENKVIHMRFEGQS